MGVVAVFVFVGTSALGFNDAGIYDADAAVFDEQPFLIELGVDFGE
jgi:hypothetical protein